MKTRTAIVMAAALAVLSGCSGSTGPPAGWRPISGYGMTIDLPPGWFGRIVLGSQRLPILQAGDFPIPSADPTPTNSGSEALQEMGLGNVYVEVQVIPNDVGGRGLPVRVERASLVRARTRPFGRRRVTVDGRAYGVRVTFGQMPSDAFLARADAVLATLKLKPYHPASSIPPADGLALRTHGITLRLPKGWRGSAAGNVLMGTSAPGKRLRPHDLALRLEELSAQTMRGVETSPAPITLGPSEFVHPGSSYVRALPRRAGESVRYLRTSGRYFLLEARSGSRPPDPDRLAQANALLASLSVRRGDFYPGSVAPAHFGAAPGWHTRVSARAKVRPDGESTYAWAGTVPFDPRDGFSLPPHYELEHLPPNGIVMIALLYAPPLTGRARLRRPPTLAQARPGGFEGQVAHTSLYQVVARTRQYNVELWIFFGRVRPSAKQRAQAQAELRRLMLPTWPAARAAER